MDRGSAIVGDGVDELPRLPLAFVGHAKFARQLERIEHGFRLFRPLDRKPVDAGDHVARAQIDTSPEGWIVKGGDSEAVELAPSEHRTIIELHALQEGSQSLCEDGVNCSARERGVGTVRQSRRRGRTVR